MLLYYTFELDSDSKKHLLKKNYLKIKKTPN